MSEKKDYTPPEQREFMAWLKPESLKPADERVRAFPALTYLSRDKLVIRAPKFLMDFWTNTVVSMGLTFPRVYKFDPKVMYPLVNDEDSQPMHIHIVADNLMRLGENNVFGHLMSSLVQSVMRNQHSGLLDNFYSDDVVMVKTADSNRINIDLPVMMWQLRAVNDNPPGPHLINGERT